MPVHFGDFTMDESRRQLLGGSGPLHLSPKAFQLLSILIEERPRAISKTDLQERLWPDTFVTEGNLSGLVAELRSALGDDAREARFIRTLYGFGYSFAAPIAHADAATPGTQPALVDVPSQNRRVSRWTGAGVAALLGAAGIVLILSLRSSTGSGLVPAGASIRSIAVLPFDTSGTDRADKHLGLGLPDLLITRLSNVRHLIVRPTSTISEFAGRHFDSRQIGRDLKVDAVLEGSVRTSPDRVRVTVQLLNVRDQRPIWAERFDEKRAEMFEIEDNISARVAEALTGRLAPNERTVLAKRYTASPVAYQLYIQARYQMREAANGAQGASGVARKKAVEFFEKAIEADPQYALAWAALSQTYSGMALFDDASPSLVYPRAEAAALKALQLDDDLPEAHCAAAFIRLHANHDFAGAERELLRALELEPRNTVALNSYAFFLTSMQRFDEAIAVRNREIEVDPVSTHVQLILANTYFTERQYDRSIQQTLMVLGMNPNHVEAHVNLARSYTLLGEHEKAIAHARKAVELNGGERPLAYLGYALAMAGRRAEANEILQNLKRLPEQQLVSPFHLAIVYLGLGDRDAALVQLEKASSDDLYAIRLKAEPMLDPLRSDPRFTALLRRAGFRS